VNTVPYNMAYMHQMRHFFNFHLLPAFLSEFDISVDAIYEPSWSELNN